jgi:uncharacterized damage-inducible protein DinB
MKTPALLALVASPLFCGSLTQGERDRALSELHATRKQFLDAVQTLSPAQWTFKPSPTSWSIAEVAEHLALTEEALPAIAAKKIQSSPPQTERRGEARDKDEAILRAGTDRTRKSEAPPQLLPKNRWASPRETLDQFRARRDRNIAYLRTTPDDLRAYFFDHPAHGPIDAYQWFLITAAHTARHLAQIEEIKSAPHYPAR